MSTYFVYRIVNNAGKPLVHTIKRSFVFQDYTCIFARSFGTFVAIAIIGISFGFSPRIS